MEIPVTAPEQLAQYWALIVRKVCNEGGRAACGYEYGAILELRPLGDYEEEEVFGAVDPADTILILSDR